MHGRISVLQHFNDKHRTHKSCALILTEAVDVNCAGEVLLGARHEQHVLRSQYHIVARLLHAVEVFSRHADGTRRGGGEVV